MTTDQAASTASERARPDHRRRARVLGARRIVGGFFLFTGGVHLGIVAADPQLYRDFADEAWFSVVRDGWVEVFMAHPALWGLALAAGETTLGVLLLRGGRGARLGWAGVIAFHVALMLFGWGFWLWSLPALAVLVPLAVADHRLEGDATAASGTQPLHQDQEPRSTRERGG